MSESGAKPRLARRIRYRLERGLLSAAVWLLPKLPRRPVQWCSAAVGTLAWMADGRGRRTGMANLLAALGPAVPIAERRRILRSSYRVFAATFFDLFWSPRVRAEDWDRWFVLECETDAAREALRKNNCLYITGHLGGFELLNVAKALAAGTAMTIAQNFKNPSLTAIFARLRSVGGRQEMIAQEGAMLRLFRHLKKGGSAGALVDLKVDVLRNGHPMRTFGMLTSASALHCVLAQRTGVPIVPLMALPSPDGRMIMHLCDPIHVAPDEPIIPAMQRTWDVFEAFIRKHPELWLWMYKHWRYVPEGVDAATYPSYAIRLPEFDMMLQAADGSSSAEESAAA